MPTVTADPLAAALVLYGQRIAQLPPEVRPAMLQLLGLLASYGGAVPAELEREVEAISLAGVSPAQQLEQLGKILDRWATRR